MVKINSKYTLKFCKFYEEDVFGRYAIRPKKFHKILNKLYLESFQEQKQIKNLYKKYKFLLIKKRQKLNYLRTIYKNKILKNITFLKFRIQFKNLNKNIQLIIKNLISIEPFAAQNKGKFNYRVDIGKPKKEKRKVTRYRLKLIARHKLTSFAGQLNKIQFKNYISKNRNLKFFSLNFLFQIESRLDVILYRLNFSTSPRFIRQFILHQGVLVNNKLITTPSFVVKFNDLITFNDKKFVFKLLYFNFIKRIVAMSIPSYYEVNFRLLCVKFILTPNLENIFFPFKIDIFRLSSPGINFS